MAVTFRKTTQGINNVWTQLKDIVSTKDLYNTDDYNTYSTEQKESYISMLYSNHDALMERMPMDMYNSRYGDSETRYSLLSAVNSKYHYDTNKYNPEYQKAISDAINKQLNEKLASDIDNNKAWVNWIVENKYNSDYAAFVEDYSGENAKTFDDLLLEQLPTEYNLSREDFTEDLENLQSQRDEIYNEYTTAQDSAYKNALESIRAKLEENANREAYENASKAEKFFNTIVQLPVLWAGEIFEIVEGVGDYFITMVAGVEELFTLGHADTDWAESAVKYDWWAPRTWLDVDNSMSYLNKFAGNNAFKFIDEVGTTIVDMAPLALNIVVPGLGTAVYYASSFGRSMEAELVQGYDFGQALIYSAGSTIIECATENLSGTKFFGGGVFKKWEKFGAKNLGTKLIHDALGEGLEEVISGIGSDLWHGAVTGDMTLTSAAGWKDLGKQFAVGALVGGIMVAGNAAVTNSIIKNTAVTLQDATSNVKLSAAKASIILDFVQRTGKKIEQGKTISERTQSRFDKLKDLVVVNTDVSEQIAKRYEEYLRTGEDIVVGERIAPTQAEVKLQPGYYDEYVQPKIARKLQLHEAVVRGMKKRADGEVPGEQIKTGETSLNEGASISGESLSMAYSALSEEQKAQLRTDFTVTGTMTFNKMLQMYGEDTVTAGIKLWSQYCDKTITEVVELLQLGSENSAYTIAEGSTEILTNSFNGAEFTLVNAKKNSEVGRKYTDILKTIKALKGVANTFKTINMQLFFTTGSTVSTSFFVGDTMYINAAWLADTNVGRIKDILIAKYCSENARRILKESDTFGSVEKILIDTMHKLENTTRSTDILLQELSFMMFFQKNNLLMQQMLSVVEDTAKDSVNKVIEYFDTLRSNFAATSVQRTAGAVLSNMLTVCEEAFDTGEDPKTDNLLPEDNSISVREIIDAYRDHEFRAFPLITGKAGIPYEAAKVQAMYSYMQRTYGFNKKLDLTRRDINWLTEFLSNKNYDNDGYVKLMSDISKYRPVKSSTGYTRGTVAKNKTAAELLNYHLDNICGLMVFNNGVIATSELTTRVFNIAALQTAADDIVNRIGAQRESIGTVAELLSDDMKSLMQPVIQNIPVYITADSNSNSQAYIIGDTNSGMSLVINISDVKALSEQYVIFGGKSLILNADGELETKSDGSFRVQDNTVKMSKLAYVIGHEIGHSIGMMLGLHGTFCETDISNAYGKLLTKMTAAQKREVIDSIANWLAPNGVVSDDMRSFAKRLGVSDNDIANNPNKADSKILAFTKKLEGLIDSDVSAKKISNLFKPLATHLYFTGFAHEMFANGKVETIAREDLIRSEMSSIQLASDAPKMSCVTITTKSDLHFIQILNGYAFMSNTNSEFIDNWLSKMQDTPENVSRRILADITKLDELAKELGVVFNSDLVNPDFWRKRLSSKDIQGTSRSNLVNAIESRYDVTYDSIDDTFVPGFVSNALREIDSSEPTASKKSAVMIFNDGKVINASNHAAYNNISGVKSFVLYTPKSGNRRANITFRITANTSISFDKKNSVIVIDGTRIPIQPHTTACFVAGGKVFNNPKAAMKYLSTKLVQASDPDFDSLFDRILEQADTTGRQAVYAEDTIYMLPDGSIYNIDINMLDWFGFAKKLFANNESKVNTLLGQFIKDKEGNFSTDNAEGISYNLARLLDDKRVVRFYRDGDTWEVYGTPNKLQEQFIDELKAQAKSSMPYIEPKLDRKLFISLAGDTPKVEIHGNNWSDNYYHEVDWKNNQWYTAIRRIMSIYGISSFKDFERLGFSKEFVDILSSGKNMTRSFILDYIRDGGNTDYSKNILIENCPDSSHNKNEGGDWKRNPHIHTIEEARQYWMLASTYAEIMPYTLTNDGKVIPKIFNNVIDLQHGIAKAQNDPKNIEQIEIAIQRADEYYKALGGEIFIQLLNKDSNTGLGFDRNSFKNALGYIRQYYENAKNSGRYKEDLAIEIHDKEGSTLGYRGDPSYIPPEFAAIEDDTSETYARIMTEVKAADEIVDTDERNAALKDLLDRIKNIEYDNVDSIRNVILNKLEGKDLSLYRRKELERLKDRIERYNKLEKNSKEELQERRKLIRLYESTRNSKLTKMLEANKDYYNSYLELLRDVGTYSANMNQAFAHFYKRSETVREHVANQENFDRQITKLRELRSALLRIDMEYPGWYENYESLLQMAKDWLDGKKESQGKTFAAVRTDIINFINSFEDAADFREYIRQREKAPTYIQAGTLRGAEVFESDLPRFREIPDNIKHISEFPKVAQVLYEKASKNIGALSNILKNPKMITKLTKQYGIDYIYNLQQLYNDMTAPTLGTGISKLTTDALAELMAEAGFDDTSIAAVKNANAKPVYNAKKEITKKRKADYIDYSKFAIDRGTREYRWLAEGKPIDDDTIKQTLKKLSGEIRDYLWLKDTEYYAIRLDLRGFNSSKQQEIINNLNGISKKAKIETVEKNGKIEYVDFLTKRSPEASLPTDSDVKAIGRKNISSKYKNKYYEYRSKISDIFNERSRISISDTDGMRTMEIDLSGYSSKESAPIVNRIKNMLGNYEHYEITDNKIIVYELPNENGIYPRTQAIYDSLISNVSRISDTTHSIQKYQTIDDLSESQKFRITASILHAYYQFMDSPRTDRALAKLEGNIGVALAHGHPNIRIPNTNQLVSIHVPDEYKNPWFDPEKKVDVNKVLAPIFNTEIKAGSTKYQEEFARFEKEIKFEDDALNKLQASLDETDSKAELLRRKRIAWDKRKIRNEGTVRTLLDESARYNISFDLERGNFVNTDGDLIAEENVDFRQLEDEDIGAYLEYTANKGLEEGWLNLSRAGNFVDPETKKIVVYGEDTKAQRVSKESFEPSEEDFEPSEEDFEPSEEDFEPVSKYLEDDMDFEPLDLDSDEQPEVKSMRGYWQTIEPENRYYRVQSGLSDNTSKMLDYQPHSWQEKREFDSKEFLVDNKEYIDRFLNSNKDMKAFVTKIESNPVIPLDSPQEYIIFALLNKVANNTALTDSELSMRAENLVKLLAARSGRILGMVKAYGTTSAEQLINLCSKLLKLNDAEKAMLQEYSKAQAKAIAANDYTGATAAFDKIIDFIKSRQKDLPVSMNAFAKGLTPEERTIRWHNIAERVTAWRYFAMLGAPSTFLTKNLGSNVIITGMDMAAESIGNTLSKIIPGNKRLSTNYSFKDEFDFVDKDKRTVLSASDVSKVLDTVISNTTDRKQIDANKLTADLNNFINSRYKVQKAMPSGQQIAARANAWMRKNFYQYKMDKAPTAEVNSIVEEKLVKNGLLASIMHDSVSKHGTGYEIKSSKLRNLTLNAETKLDEISEETAAILADAARKDSPFKFELLNKYYRFIFKTMEWGDKKFIEPKIKRTTAKLVASNMTAAELIDLRNNKRAATAKFNELVSYATEDAMKTYFRENSDFQKKVMQLFDKHPIAQLIFGTIIPFPRMAINVMNTALSYSPVGFLRALMTSHNSQDAFTNLKVSKELGKACVGTVLIAIGATLAACGILDFDDDDEYAGVQLVFGDKFRIALSDFTPSAMPLVIGATMTNGFTKGFWNGLYAGTDSLLDATLLGEAIEVFGGNKESPDVITDTFSSFVNQFIPSIFRHMARTIDPTQKQYSSNKGFKIIQRIAAAIPGVSLLVPSKIDPYTGNAVYQNTGANEGWARILSFVNAFAPAKITTSMSSMVEEESKAVGAATTGPARTYKIDGVEYTMSEELYRSYQTLRAKLYSKYAQEIINTKAYQSMSIEKKRAKLKQLQNKATQEARKQLNIGY